MLTYIKALPTGYQQGDQLPVVAFFPGHKGTYMKWKKTFAIEQKTRKFIGLYFSTPTGGWNVYAHLSEIQGILFQESASLTRDFYAVGISNGACLSLQLLCRNLFKGVVSFAGSLFVGDVAISPEGRKIMMFNGKKDNSVPFYGGNAHGVNMMGAIGAFEAFTGQEIAPIRMIGEKTDFYKANDGDIRLYAFDNYGHDVYARVANGLEWPLTTWCMEFLNIAKI
jgi:hypothetical protein